MPETVAVKVTAWLPIEGFGALPIVTLGVSLGFTTCERESDVPAS